MASSTVLRKDVSGASTEYARKPQGRKKSSVEEKQSKPITFWETVSGEDVINAEAKRMGMSRSAFCSMAVTLYINATREIG